MDMTVELVSKDTVVESRAVLSGVDSGVVLGESVVVPVVLSGTKSVVDMVSDVVGVEVVGLGVVVGVGSVVVLWVIVDGKAVVVGVVELVDVVLDGVVVGVVVGVVGVVVEARVVVVVEVVIGAVVVVVGSGGVSVGVWKMKNVPP